MSTTTTLENGECPCCNSKIAAITADSPSQHTVQPCGCTLPGGPTARTGGDH